MDTSSVNTVENIQPTVREKIRKVFSSKLFIVMIIAIAISLITGIVDVIKHRPDFTSFIEWAGNLFSVNVSSIVNALKAAEVAMMVGSFVKLIPTAIAIVGLVFILLAVKKEENASVEQFARGTNLVKWYFIIQTIKITLLEITTLIIGIAAIVMAAKAGSASVALIIIAILATAIVIGALAIVDIYYTNNTLHFRTLAPSYQSNKNIVQISFYVVVINYIRVAIAIIGAIRNGGWLNAIVLSVTLVMVNIMLTSYRKKVGAVDVEARKEFVEKLKQAKLAKKAK